MPPGSSERRPPPIVTRSSPTPGRLISPSSGTTTVFSQMAPKHRTSHACDRCRAMRTKCSGGSRCTKCVKDDAVCIYGDRKRERNRKDLVESIDRVRNLEDENRDLISFLRRLANSPSLSIAEAANIADFLDKHDADERAESSPSRTRTSSSLQSPTDTWKSLDLASDDRRLHTSGERYTNSEVGSPGRQGELSKVVGLDHGIGAAGLVGKMSEMSWMQRAREYLIGPPVLEADLAPDEISQHAAAAEQLAYFMDDWDLLAVDEEYVESLQWPSYRDTLILTEAFFHATHVSCQFVLRDQFFDVFSQLRHAQPVPGLHVHSWLAVANLVWAVASKWLHMLSLDQSLADNHLVYYARARALGIDHRVFFDHPNVETVQGIGLLSFYLLINGSISRARNVLGHAIRHATALGLHLKVTDASLSVVEQEQRARTWYSLYSLEILITETTGRPASIQAAQITISSEIADRNSYIVLHPQTTDLQAQSRQLWIQFLAGSVGPPLGTTGLGIPAFPTRSGPDLEPKAFTRHIQLCRISDAITLRLYTGAPSRPWSELQRLVESLQAALEHWAMTLPSDLGIEKVFDGLGDVPTRVGLAMYYHSLAMILHRNCLCEVIIEDESTRSKEFNLVSARACVHAAMSMADLLPDNIVPARHFLIFPWWTLLHYICQAASVLLLELCLNCQHFEGESSDVISQMTKTMASLWCLTDKSKSAYRAWRILSHLLQQVLRRYADSTAVDAAIIKQHPSLWTEYDETTLGHLLR